MVGGRGKETEDRGGGEEEEEKGGGERRETQRKRGEG